ncbi:unnamed protein product [Rotaria sp. Silwood2]|nr:unnamed protein product [Rotaria sp. Silwood2]CAF2633815.1 unnamed protein product [Rotaria sp. Silwood2]CAF2883395.1 unnamed protein product [Rotaria sp. Silwood2]CAF3035024.1 unnamed protein product [Rotaria sp. Silwood2]CAF3916215.1 unnamed protein product [Rotaria sp. Silwood2]
MSSKRDPFFDDDVASANEHSEQDRTPPVPTTRKRLSNDVETTEITEDPTVIPRPSSPHSPLRRSSSSSSHSLSSSSSSSRLSPPSQQHPIVSQPEKINEEVHKGKSSSSSSSTSDSFESDEDQDEIQEEKEKEKDQHKILHHSKVDVNTQTDQIAVRDESIQTNTVHIELLTTPTTRKIGFILESKKLTTPLVKNLLDQKISSTLPIVSFCQPFSMTSHLDDIILAMPRHLMIINNQNSISVYPWQQSEESTSTILECFWCTFLYKLLVTTLEDNRLFIYDFISIIDSIKLRGRPLSIKHQSYYSKQINSSLLLPSSSRYQSQPAIWSQTRFTKSNSLGIYYCYISNRQYSCMLTRIDHNTRKHIRSIDCSGGSVNNNTRVCAMGLSDERVAIVLTNLIMTLHDAETLLGLHQLNLTRSNVYDIRGVSSIMYLWKTWLIFDPIENKIVGIGKRKREFVKMLPEQPINACSMDNGTLALWLGYPGALLYYRLIE